MEQKRFNSLITTTKKELHKKLLELYPPTIQFTDHALVRYLERVCNVNTSIYTDGFIEQYKDVIYKQGGDCTIVHNSIKIIVKDFKIITVIDKDDGK